MFAAEKGAIEYLQTLIDIGAYIDFEDAERKTALFYAIEANTENVDAVSILLAGGANINHETKGGITPFLRAVEKNYFEIVKQFLGKGALVNAALENGSES
jgi:ankyrin repeat protein